METPPSDRITDRRFVCDPESKHKPAVLRIPTTSKVWSEMKGKMVFRDKDSQVPPVAIKYMDKKVWIIMGADDDTEWGKEVIDFVEKVHAPHNKV